MGLDDEEDDEEDDDSRPAAHLPIRPVAQRARGFASILAAFCAAVVGKILRLATFPLAALLLNYNLLVSSVYCD